MARREVGDTLSEALKLITADRNASYGDVREDFTRTVHIFRAVKPDGIIETAEDGVLFMMCVKLSREANAHKSDNIVDLCGYADLLNYLKAQEGSAYAENTRRSGSSGIQDKA